MAYILEETKGNLPTWLAPVQVKVMPVKTDNEELMAYAQEVCDALDAADVRVELDGRAEKLGYRMREAQVQKVPYLLVIGFNEMEGKTVSIGAKGSGVYFNALDLLGAYGLTENDIKAEYLDFGDSADSLKDGKIDAAFVVAGAPTPAIQDLGTGKQVYLVSLDKEHIDNLIASSPYYKEYTISKDVYNTPEDVTTVAVAAVVIARNDVSEAAIYNFVSAIFDNIDEIGHAKKAELSLDFASSITDVPYHPGAAKYFAEKDITVNTAA